MAFVSPSVWQCGGWCTAVFSGILVLNEADAQVVICETIGVAATAAKKGMGRESIIT